MYIDSWVKKHTYDTFKEVLGSGMQYHLQVSGQFSVSFTLLAVCLKCFHLLGNVNFILESKIESL